MKVAYLAPEIPALSATFVYNEIFQLEKLGLDIETFSVHDNQVIFSDPDLQSLKNRTHFLYRTSIFSVTSDHIHIILKNPVSYLKTLYFLFSDFKNAGVFLAHITGIT